MSPPPPLPGKSSDAYLWYIRGQEDEVKARREGLSTGAIEMIVALEALAKLGGISSGPQKLVTSLAKIYCPEILRWRYRREDRH